MIYVINAGRYFKFGFSKHPKKRMRQLQTGNGCRMRLLAEFPGSKRLEGRLHKHLRHHRTTGEWFSGEAVEAFVRECLEAGYIDLTLDPPPLAPVVPKKHVEKVRSALPGWKQELEDLKAANPWFTFGGAHKPRRKNKKGKRRRVSAPQYGR